MMLKLREKAKIRLAVASMVVVTAGFFSSAAQPVFAQPSGYEKARAAYANAFNEYRAARAEFLRAKAAIRRGATVPPRVRAEVLAKAKRFLTRVANAMIKYLEAMKHKALGASGISDAERSSILAALDAKIALLQGELSKIEAASTREQVLERAKFLRTEWRNIRTTARRVTGLVLAAKAARLIKRGEDRADQLAERIAALKSSGKDVSGLEALLADMRKQLTSATEKQRAAKTKFDSIESPAGARLLFRQGIALLKEARNALKQAHQDALRIRKGLREQGGSPSQ